MANSNLLCGSVRLRWVWTGGVKWGMVKYSMIWGTYISAKGSK